jgi:hypothetical protein
MDTTKMLFVLRQQRGQIAAAIVILERLATGEVNAGADRRPGCLP